MTGHQLDVLRGISEHFVTGEGDFVLTDISRPIILEYFFPEASVRQMMVIPDDQSMAEVETSLQQEGIVIIGSPEWAQALATSLEGRTHFYNISDQAGTPRYMVIKLPVGAK
jgi:hypothetical protein